MANKALLIANWAYADPERMLLPLTGPEHNLDRLTKALSDDSYGLFPPENIRVERNLSMTGIGKAMWDFTARSVPDDYLLIYYTGLSVRLSTGELGLCGVDAERSSIEPLSFNSQQLRTWLTGTRARSKVVVLDCSYAGAFLGGAVDTDRSFGEGIGVLASGGMEPVPDSAEDSPTPFTDALASVLLDPDIGVSRYLYIEDAFAALQNRRPQLIPAPRYNPGPTGRLPLARRPVRGVHEDGPLGQEITAGTNPSRTSVEAKSVQSELDTVDRRRALAARYADDSASTTALVRGDADSLGIAKDVDMLASVIGSRQIQPPLALGIFGAWGAGKSFLMSQLQMKIDDLARRSRNQKSLFCCDIVHVEFNAWQYSDGHLWASLVNRVFEKLGDHLQRDARYVEALAAIERQDDEVRRAHERVDSARRAVEETAPPHSHRTVADLVQANPEVSAAATQLANRLGLDKATTEIADVERQVEEFGNLWGRLRLAWAASTPARRVGLLLGLLVVVLLVVLAVRLPAGRAVSFIGAVTVGLTAVVNVIKPTNEVLRAARRVLHADHADRASYEEARRALTEAEKELGRLRREGPGGLYRFVQERYEAADYRQYLGMVPLIRADLKRLSEWALPPGAPPQIERIVVYIDDLDRCRAPQVVKILEAVHLLFSFPLFVVVIAVDSRWLLHSLRSEFQGVFAEEGVIAASPQDYLEKIIQIPFWLRPMSDIGFERLVSQMVDHQATGDQPVAKSEDSADRADEQVLDSSPALLTSDDEPAQQAARSVSEAPVPIEPPVEADEPDLLPQSLVMSAEEVAFMRSLGPLVRTPRATKRFVNSYQLLRVSIDDVAGFLADEEYVPLLLLLAMVTGTLELTGDMLADLYGLSAPDLAVYLKDTDARWAPFRQAMAELPGERVSRVMVRRWLPAVARFSFHGHADMAPRNSADSVS